MKNVKTLMIRGIIESKLPKWVFRESERRKIPNGICSLDTQENLIEILLSQKKAPQMQQAHQIELEKQMLRKEVRN